MVAEPAVDLALNSFFVCLHVSQVESHLTRWLVSSWLSRVFWKTFGETATKVQWQNEGSSGHCTETDG